MPKLIHFEMETAEHALCDYRVFDPKKLTLDRKRVTCRRCLRKLEKRDKKERER